MRAIITVTALILALGLLACGEDSEPVEPEPVGREESEPDTGEDDSLEVIEVTRLDGVTTVSESELDGDEGPPWRDAVPRIEQVGIPSSADGTRQPALWLEPTANDGSAPLIILVHSWSYGYRANAGIPIAEWADANEWAFIAPDFRGPFNRPQATGSDFAVSDVIDALDFAVRHDGVDAERAFVIGVSGGGMMSLLMAGRHPGRFAGAAAWVPIHDLTAWHNHNTRTQPELQYTSDIESSCGGDPTAGEAARAECVERSPRAHLGAARQAGVPIYIAHGLDDTIVPPDHAARAFNQLARPQDRLGDGAVRALTQNRLPGALRGEIEAETHFREPDPAVLHARESGAATLVFFDGEHDMAYHPGLEWIAGIAAGSD